ncbi:MAG: methyltransferase domain-containing protein [Pseudomonadota bacterium]|nr:methyltransferase domain-containing protein [Pseudomonadota bacterium]
MAGSKQELRISNYEREYTADYRFESVMVQYRQRIILELIERIKPKSVIEIGCGLELLFDRAIKVSKQIEDWKIIEPAPKFRAVALERSKHDRRLFVIEDFLENIVDEISSSMSEPPDLCLISGVLHEVEDPARFLTSLSKIISNKTLVHANVPNAFSLHRRLAKSMDIIKEVYELNERNAALQQNRVFDYQTFSQLFMTLGYKVESTGGYMIKPFTHGQMVEIQSVATEEVLDGLFKLGRELPELAAEIFLTARL